MTLFLERIRNAASRVPSLATTSSATFYVTIITGSGSHSSHGPILRSVVQRLLEKRGMTYQLERGGGAFRVNTLSGHDLYQAGAPVDSKVVVVNDNDSFHQMASASRRSNPNERGSFADTVGIMQQQQKQQSRSTTQSSHRPMHTLSIPIAAAAASQPSSFYDPLPSQVAAEDKNVRTALEQSSNEINNLQRYRDQMERKHEEELERAIEASRKSLSDANDAASQEREGQQSLLQLVSERSIVDEEIRKEQAQREFEEELLRAIEQSLHLEQLKGEEDEETNASEEYLMQKALAESEKIKTPEDELLQKILAESLMEQKRIEEEEQQMLRQAINDSSNVVVEANHNNLSAEEEELRRVIEMSKKDR